jgi:hypothetical protein
MTHTFQGVWPITDETMTRNELIAEGQRSIPTLVMQAHATVIGPITWRIADASEIAGWSAYTGLLLVAEASAHPALRPGVHPSRQIDAIRHATANGWTDQRIADHIGYSRGQVLAIRHKNNIQPAPNLAAA